MDPHTLKVQVNAHHHHAHLPILFLRHCLKERPRLCHHGLDAVSTFLTSVGSLLNQSTRSHILCQLKTTIEMRAAAALVPSLKVWQTQDDLSTTKPLPSPAFFCLALPLALLSSGPALTMTTSETQSTPNRSLLIALQHLLHCLN